MMYYGGATIKQIISAVNFSFVNFISNSFVNFVNFINLNVLNMLIIYY